MKAWSEVRKGWDGSHVSPSWTPTNQPSWFPDALASLALMRLAISHIWQFSQRVSQVSLVTQVSLSILQNLPFEQFSSFSSASLDGFSVLFWHIITSVLKRNTHKSWFCQFLGFWVKKWNFHLVLARFIWYQMFEEEKNLLFLYQWCTMHCTMVWRA